MSKTTTNQGEKEIDLKARNETVRNAYFNILADIKSALPQYPTEYLRTLVEIDYSSLGMKCLHAFFSPLIHIQLEDTEGQLIISFSRNFAIKQQVSNYLDCLLSRIVYKNTAEAATEIFIEDAVSCEPFKVDDFRNANALILKGFKDGKKVTV